MFRSSRKYMPTFVIIAANLIVYAYTSLLSGDILSTADNVLVQFGQFNLYVFEGAYWQLITSMFVHVTIVHLVGNMFFMLIFGLRAEEIFSIEEYLFVYLAGGLAGNLLTLLMGPLTVSAGASGAIFATFGAVTMYIRRAVGQSIMGALIYAFFLLIISSGLGVNILAHLGGLVAGLAMGYVLGARRRSKAVYEYSYSYR